MFTPSGLTHPFRSMTEHTHTTDQSAGQPSSAPSESADTQSSSHSQSAPTREQLLTECPVAGCDEQVIQSAHHILTEHTSRPETPEPQRRR
jgi:hypothetical protein